MGANVLYAFSDSSWNNDVDSGRSTGCFLVYYIGGVVDHSSNLLYPIALSSANAEYTECCIAGMAMSHLTMLLDELEQVASCRTIPIILDSSAAIAMGNSFKDTKHTRHILQ